MQEQRIIVEAVENKLQRIDLLVSEIEKQLQKSETLRQSILKKAFSGQLVEQDPNDEPASVLLERIKAEKARQTPRDKRGKRKAANA